jgi:hypothetical protein
MHKDVEEKSLAELAPSYAVASAYLIHIFLKFYDIEDPEKKSFILETLCIEFRDVAIEARKVLKRFNKLSSHVEVVGTPNEESRVPIPCKLVGIHDALEKNFSWICPKNLFDKSS